MPASRPADYYIGCLDAAVFIDFIEKNRKIFLKRISFDGYGCCEPAQQTVAMRAEDMQNFISMINDGTVDQARMYKIIRKTLADNSRLLWVDALKEYGFLD